MFEWVACLQSLQGPVFDAIVVRNAFKPSCAGDFEAWNAFKPHCSKDVWFRLILSPTVRRIWVFLSAANPPYKLWKSLTNLRSNRSLFGNPPKLDMYPTLQMVNKTVPNDKFSIGSHDGFGWGSVSGFEPHCSKEILSKLPLGRAALNKYCHPCFETTI